MARFKNTHGLEHHAPRKRQYRLLRIRRVALALILALSIGMLPAMVPARVAFASQTLELPSSAPSSTSNPSIENPPPPQARIRSTDPLPPGLGTIDDYEAQDPSYRSSAGSNAPSGNAPAERRANQPALVNEVVVGALVLGVLAMEMHAAHRHR